MYPKKLENDERRAFFSEETYFQGKFNYIHAYLHTDYKYKMHSHQFYEINIITLGEGRHYIENTSLDIKSGDVFVIPPNVSHGYYSEKALDIYHLLIKNDFIERYADELNGISGFNILFDIEPQIRRNSGRNLNINSGAHMVSAFKAELDEIAEAESLGDFIYLNILTLGFIHRLCKRICGAVSASCEREVVEIMEYVKNNLDAKITLGRLCEQAHMSPSTLNRRFRAVTGQSPMDYVLSARIAKAVKLIEDNAFSKTDIAHACGFYDIAHMNKYLE